MAGSCDCPTVQKEIHYEKHDNCPDTEFVIMSIKTMVPMKMDPAGTPELANIEKRVQAVETALQQTIWGANTVATEQRQCFEQTKLRKVCEEEEKRKRCAEEEKRKRCEEEKRIREQQQQASASSQAALCPTPCSTPRKQWEHTPAQNRGVMPNWANRSALVTPTPSQMAQCPRQQPPPTSRIPQRLSMPTRASVTQASHAGMAVKQPWRSGGPTGGSQSYFGAVGSAPSMIPRHLAATNMSLMRSQRNISSQSVASTSAGPWMVGTPAASSTMISELQGPNTNMSENLVTRYNRLEDSSIPQQGNRRERQAPASFNSSLGTRTLEDLVAGFNDIEDSAVATVEISSIEHKVFADFNDSMASNTTQ